MKEEISDTQVFLDVEGIRIPYETEKYEGETRDLTPQEITERARIYTLAGKSVSLIYLQWNPEKERMEAGFAPFHKEFDATMKRAKQEYKRRQEIDNH